ncbi:Transcriptional regulator, IclR family [Leucobacter sp. 7(1)]|uniref:IclR family transcriptional regulator n=1 Tax=Leucobacter sp. 7(1) TaxID=1255613 RepID=UPI00097ED878|nr:IclR family transcriptional regulator C-terminal domain-containing protein [Leucobacter sp. 7(1)]SJN09725.1 Transcriptional regulator, IclR family [Leucobacter sp. 7(1)]
MPFIPATERKRPTLQTVDRALSFLEIVSERPDGVTVRDVAAELGINVTTCYHLYNTLLARDYIERNADGTMRLGNNVAALYEGYRRGFSNQEEMLTIVRHMSKVSQETAFISLRVNDAVILTAFTEGPQPVKAGGLYVGLSGLEHVRATGKAVLAFLGAEDRKRMLDRSLSAVPPAQWPVLVSRLEEELREIEARGWAIDDEGYESGIVGVAAPYFSRDGGCMGAVGIWSPKDRWGSQQDRILQAVLESAQEASLVLGRMA